MPTPEREQGETIASATRRERHRQLVDACAIAHGQGAGMSTTDLMGLILELGLPPRAERERVLAERLGDNTTASS